MQFTKQDTGLMRELYICHLLAYDHDTGRNVSAALVEIYDSQTRLGPADMGASTFCNHKQKKKWGFWAISIIMKDQGLLTLIKGSCVRMVQVSLPPSFGKVLPTHSNFPPPPPWNFNIFHALKKISEKVFGTNEDMKTRNFYMQDRLFSNVFF